MSLRKLQHRNPITSFGYDPSPPAPKVASTNRRSSPLPHPFFPSQINCFPCGDDESMAESSPPDMQLTPDQNDPARKDGGLALPRAAPASQTDASAPARTSPQPTTSTLRHSLHRLGLQGS